MVFTPVWESVVIVIPSPSAMESPPPPPPVTLIAPVSGSISKPSPMFTSSSLSWLSVNPVPYLTSIFVPPVTHVIVAPATLDEKMLLSFTLRIDWLTYTEPAGISMIVSGSVERVGPAKWTPCSL